MEKTSSGRAGQVGSQTLARGLRALLFVADADDGVTVQIVATELEVHRSIAYRLLQTLVEYGLVTHGEDGSYRPGPRLATLSHAYLPALQEAAIPVMRELADSIGASVSLFILEGDEAVAIKITEPTTATHHIAFRAGMRTPLDRGAAGYCLLAADPPRPGEPKAVALARQRGYATSSGEVLAGAYAVAALIPGLTPRACLNVITHQEHQALEAEKVIEEATRSIGQRLTV